jgi:N-acetylmuramate 1-kinase
MMSNSMPNSNAASKAAVKQPEAVPLASIAAPAVATWSASLTDVDEANLVGLAQRVALALRQGDVVALEGDLGAGKTTFARALIRILLADAAAEVPSPTFALAQGYNSARFPIAHFDFYRLSRPEDVEEIGFSEAVLHGVAIVEWPSKAAKALPPNRLELSFTETSASGTRNIDVTATGQIATRLARIGDMDGFIGEAGWGEADIAYLQGDASTRAYARLSIGSGRAVIMDAPRQPDGPPVRDGKPYSRIAHLAEDVRPFVAVDQALRKAGLSAPDILAADLDQGFLLLEDFGDRVFGRETSNELHQAELWTAALDALVALRRANPAMSMPVGGGTVISSETHTLPRLDRNILEIETDMLPDWYWPEVKGTAMPAALRAEYRGLWRPVIDRLLAETPGWILRDVHSPNLLWMPEWKGIARVGFIDFQDALAGPWSHDVMSLLQDARVDVPEKLEARLLTRYCSTISMFDPVFNDTAFRSGYAAYGALRATRLVGLFVRLLRRDGKANYLQHMARNWGYLERNLAHPKLRPLAEWYDTHFSAELRQQPIDPRPRRAA